MSVDRLYLIFGSMIVAIIMGFGLWANSNVTIPEGENEWSNNVTLIVEIGVGIVVTLFVLLFTKVSEKKMDRKIDWIKQLVTNEARDLLYKKSQGYDEMYSKLNPLEIIILNLSLTMKVYEDRGDTLPEMAGIFKANKSLIKKFTNELSELELINVNNFTHDQVAVFDKIITELKALEQQTEKTCTSSNLRDIEKQIDESMTFLQEKRHEIQQDISNLSVN